MILGKTSEVTLPGGLWIEGRRHQQARLRPVTGREEALLAEMPDGDSLARRTTALLACCLTRLGPQRRVGPEQAACLTVGDRQALLLHLRRLTLGERIQCVVRCPHADCGERMDVEVGVGQLLLAPYSEFPEHPETIVDHRGVSYKVRFRLPTGADQEASTSLAITNPGAAADLLLRRCVESVEPGSNGDLPGAKLARRISRLMREMDRQAELKLMMECAECGLNFSCHFDAASYFFQELEAHGPRLEREVHLLAFYYHWSEREILSLPTPRRARYLQLLSESLSERRRR